MRLFKKIAKAAGAAGRKDKADAGAAAAESKAGDEGEKQPAAERETPPQPDAKAAAAAGTGKVKAEAAEALTAEEEARLRASYETLTRENEELKQRNRFLLQMLAVSRLDEQKLEDEIQQCQEQLGSPNRSIASSVSSPVHRRV
eukprot:Tamp_24591.p4 GENE.Tamp_24591~~Tamp_24591.p4  ORF type:complete len:144 (+),score=49.50 Tamp_24591:60-491(+)